MCTWKPIRQRSLESSQTSAIANVRENTYETIFFILKLNFNIP